MALHLGSLPLNIDAFGARNYTGSDIAAGTLVALDTTAANIGGVVTASDDNVFGVALETLKAGKQGRVQVHGVAVVTSGGAIPTRGTLLCSGTSGQAGNAVAAANAKKTFAENIDTAAGAGEQIRVFLRGGRTPT